MPLLHPLSLLLLVHFQPDFELIDFVGESRQERAEDWDLSTPELYRSFPDQTVYQESFSVSKPSIERKTGEMRETPSLTEYSLDLGYQ